MQTIVFDLAGKRRQFPVEDLASFLANQAYDLLVQGYELWSVDADNDATTMTPLILRGSAVISNTKAPTDFDPSIPRANTDALQRMLEQSMLQLALA